MTKRPSPALIISVIALFVALGGTAIAAGGLISGSKLKNRSVAAVKLKKHTLTGNEINLGKLGTVPSAAVANRADHASSADNATHASSADSATHASSADSASSFGGLTASQYSHADTYAGFQPTATHLLAPDETVSKLTTPSLAPGTYILIARAEPDETAASNLTVSCSLTGPSGAGLDTASTLDFQNQDADLPLIGTDTSTSPGSAVVSCVILSGNHPFSLFAQLSAIRIGSETHSGTMTPG